MIDYEYILTGLLFPALGYVYLRQENLRKRLDHVSDKMDQVLIAILGRKPDAHK